MPELPLRLARCPAALRELGVDLLLALCYFSSARLGLQLIPQHGTIAAIWPPIGLALAALLILGVRVWPGVVLGALAAMASMGHPVGTVLILTTAGTGAALLGWWLLRHFGFQGSIERVRDVGYLMATALLTGVLCPTAGVPSLVLSGRLGWDAAPATWITWTAADISGVLMVTPLILTWTRPPSTRPDHRSRLGFAAFLVTVLLISILTFSRATPPAEPRYLLLSTIFPLLIWSALQFGPRETVLGAVIVCTAGTVAWLHGRVAFPDASVNEPTLVINLFIDEIMGTALLLGAITAQRRRAYDELEQRVAERTAQLAKSGEEKELLLKEIHHRVKNNMQVICSLLNLEARGFVDERLATAFSDSQYRIKSMALVHEHLYQSQTLGRISMSTYLHALVDGVANSQPQGERVRWEVFCEEITLPIDMAVPCGLIVNEIVTNVFKHAFPDGRSGHLTVKLSRATGEAIELRVSDDGVGLPTAGGSLAGGSFGMRLISMLVEQLQATLEILPTPGTTLRLVIPQAARG